MPTKKIGINDIETDLIYFNNNLPLNNNLLINSNFANPVLQRGTDVLTSTKQARYVFDRWKGALKADFIVNDEYITMYSETEQYSGYGVTPEMQQGIEDIEFYKNKKIIGQLRYRITKGNEWHFFWFCTDDSGKIIYTQQEKLIHDGQWHTHVSSMILPQDTKILEFRIHHGQAIIENNIYKEWASGNISEVSIDLKWGKVEANEIATDFIPRTYNEELLLCQPYYQRVQLSAANTAPYYITTNDIHFIIQANRLIRTPSIEFLSTTVFNAGNPISGFTYSFYNCNHNDLSGNVAIVATKANHGLTKNDMLYLYNTIAFDCELQ